LAKLTIQLEVPLGLVIGKNHTTLFLKSSLQRTTNYWEYIWPFTWQHATMQSCGYFVTGLNSRGRTSKMCTWWFICKARPWRPTERSTVLYHMLCLSHVHKEELDNLILKKLPIYILCP